MSFRHDLDRMRREHKKDAERMDARIEELAQRTDNNFEQVHHRMFAMRDYMNEQFSAVGNTFGDMRADYQELSRTLKGRTRLLEDRFGNLLEAFEKESVTQADLQQLEQRVKALEDKQEPAA